MEKNARSATVDCLRGTAILAVVTAHYLSLVNSPFRIGGGVPVLPPFAWIGVDAFFAISGYLLGGQLLSGRIGAATFYLRRASRILPLYALLILITWPLLSVSERDAVLTFTQNFVWAAHNPLWGYWIGPTWSLAVEEQFYLLLPLLIFVVPARRLPAVLLTIALASAAFRMFVTRDQSFFLLPGRMDCLALGIFAAWRVKFAGAILPRLPRIRPIEALGRISYPVYLFHMPCSGAVALIFGTGPWVAGVAFVVTICVAKFLHSTLERPIHEWAKSLTIPRWPTAIAT